jgi:hypothetical protein
VREGNCGAAERLMGNRSDHGALSGCQLRSSLLAVASVPKASCKVCFGEEETRRGQLGLLTDQASSEVRCDAKPSYIALASFEFRMASISWVTAAIRKTIWYFHRHLVN